MRRIHLQEDIRPLSDFRANAASLIQQIRSKKRALVLTQRGHSAAVILDVAEYERLLEELEILRDVQEAVQQLDQGKGVPHGKARKQVLKSLR